MILDGLSQQHHEQTCFNHGVFFVSHFLDPHLLQKLEEVKWTKF